MTDEKIPETFPVYVTWESFTPDRRQWKPSNPVLKVDIKIRVDVPIDYFADKEEILKSPELYSFLPAELGILIPAGMRYVIDQFESVMSDKETKPEDFKSTDDKDLEWEGDETENPVETATETWEETEKPIEELEWEN